MREKRPVPVTGGRDGPAENASSLLASEASGMSARRTLEVATAGARGGVASPDAARRSRAILSEPRTGVMPCARSHASPRGVCGGNGRAGVRGRDDGLPGFAADRAPGGGQPEEGTAFGTT